MSISESELRERLLGDDDALAEATLREHFVPTPRNALSFHWCPVPSLQADPGPDEQEGWRERWMQRMIDLANGAESRLRHRRFLWRRRRYPSWPVILSEGDSWVAHPFVKDLTDWLSDEDCYQYSVLSKGAAGDMLEDMEREREQEEALRDGAARALVLSGGGNDMLRGFRDLVETDRPGAESVDRILEVLEPHMADAMCTMQRLLQGVRRVAPDVPILVHGYDYLRVGPRGKGRFLSPFFDAIGVDDHGARVEVIRALVDRFNVGLAQLSGEIDRVRYVDLRNLVPDDEWSDEIHPDKDGFARLGAVVASALREELDRATAAR